MFVVLEVAEPFAAPGSLSLCRQSACPVFRDPFVLLEPIYRRERSAMLRYLGRRVGADMALDLLHEVFLRAAASPQVGQLVNPAGFVYRIAHNLLIDRARRSRCQLELLPMIEARDAPLCAEQEQGIEASDLQIVLDRALASLPTKTRRVFVMSRFGGMSYREIQAALGISLATVEYHMMRALSELRQAMQAADLQHRPPNRTRSGQCSRKNNFN